MNWQEIIRPVQPAKKVHPQITQNTQNRHQLPNFEYFEQFEDKAKKHKTQFHTPSADVIDNSSIIKRDRFIGGSEPYMKPSGTPYLSNNGEFRVRGGLLPEGMTILDALLEVGASDGEIEKHIGPIHMPVMWARWLKIKATRALNHEIKR